MPSPWRGDGARAEMRANEGARGITSSSTTQGVASCRGARHGSWSGKHGVRPAKTSPRYRRYSGAATRCVSLQTGHGVFRKQKEKGTVRCELVIFSPRQCEGMTTYSAYGSTSTHHNIQIAAHGITNFSGDNTFPTAALKAKRTFNTGRTNVIQPWPGCCVFFSVGVGGRHTTSGKSFSLDDGANCP